MPATKKAPEISRSGSCIFEDFFFNFFLKKSAYEHLLGIIIDLHSVQAIVGDNCGIGRRHIKYCLASLKNYIVEYKQLYGKLLHLLQGSLYSRSLYSPVHLYPCMYVCVCIFYVFYVLHALCMFITWPNTPVTPKATLRVPVPSSLQTKERKHTHTHEHTQTGSEIDFAYALRESGRRTLTPLEPTTDEVDGHELLLVLVVILIVHKPNGKLSVLRARGQHHR